MNWINFFFYVIVLNSLTGTVAYLLCKLLALVAKKYNAIRIIYPLYRLVLLFYIVPLGYNLYQVQSWIFLWISRYRRWLFWESRNSFADSAMPGDMDYRYDWYLCSILCGKVEKVPYNVSK